ncbi:MAG: hypothetical protein Q8N59_03050 [bacterium]|nr:hypothetical protein [bacterium]
MANLIERGSIHSVIEEFRKSKGLFSWSYTYRILNMLSEDDSLEISRAYRKVMFKILKKFGFKSKGFCVAVDITARPFYGSKDLLMVKGCKRKAGTNYGIHYLTASIIEEGVRFNLLCFPISSLSSVSIEFSNLVKEVRSMIPVKLLFLDRGFGNKEYSKILKLLKHKFLMPITRNNKLKELKLNVKEQLILEKDEYGLVIMGYVFSEDRAKEYHVEVKLIILYEDGETFFFITNMYDLSMEEYYHLTEVYRYRFGIETGYRMDNVFSPFTCSVTATLRYLLMQVSLIVQDLWTMVNFLLHKKERKQPREKYKNNYSIIDVVKARIKDLGFTWRPVITAVQFKRQAEKTLT